jgi:hypothetical protein
LHCEKRNHFAVCILEIIKIINCFPVAVCHNIRIANSRIGKGKKYRGRCVSKRCWFYGFKVHLIVTSGGIPVEFTFTAESKHALDGLRQLPVNLPEGSEVLADSAYTDYLMEEMLSENGIRLLANRKSNSRHPHNPYTEYLISIGRKQVELAFSDIAKYLPKKIHAVTISGFLIKFFMFFWAYSFDKLYKL